MTQTNIDKIINDIVNTKWTNTLFNSKDDVLLFAELQWNMPHVTLEEWKAKNVVCSKKFYKSKNGARFDLKYFVRMWHEQHGRCAICPPNTSHPFEIFRKNCDDGYVVIDHNHNTGVVRGLVCGQCNSILGFARDNKGRLGRAIAYLHENGDYEME